MFTLNVKKTEPANSASRNGRKTNAARANVIIAEVVSILAS